VGDNLATAIWNADPKRGLVLDGAIRDMEGIFRLGCRFTIAAYILHH